MRAVCFDVFGTLVVLREYRRPNQLLIQFLDLVAPEEARRATRLLMTSRLPDLRSAADLLSSVFQRPRVPDSIVRFAQEELELHLESSVLVEGVMETLSSLAARGLAIGLVSNMSEYYSPVVEQFGIRRRVQATAHSFETGALKPESRVFHSIAERLGAPPAEIVMVGDSPEDDCQGAISAGMSTILFDPEGRETGVLAVRSLKDIITAVAR